MVPPASGWSVGVWRRTSVGFEGASWSDDLGFAGEGAGAFGALARVRSSWTREVVDWRCHSITAPFRVGVACNCWIGGGAAPATEKVGAERPAERPAALRIWMR